jgi:hypothetical protein
MQKVPIFGVEKYMSDQQEAFYERAAIIQFCSGLPTMTCEQAEKLAAEQMGMTDDEAEFLMWEKNDAKS